MRLVRLLATLFAAAALASVVLFLVTGQRRWLRLGWRIIRPGILILLIAFGFYALERFLLVYWSTCSASAETLNCSLQVRRGQLRSKLKKRLGALPSDRNVFV
jgi:hypothetical protein